MKGSLMSKVTVKSTSNKHRKAEAQARSSRMHDKLISKIDRQRSLKANRGRK